MKLLLFLFGVFGICQSVPNPGGIRIQLPEPSTTVKSNQGTVICQSIYTFLFTCNHYIYLKKRKTLYSYTMYLKIKFTYHFSKHISNYLQF
jgi:hypothetical protein